MANPELHLLQVCALLLELISLKELLRLFFIVWLLLRINWDQKFESEDYHWYQFWETRDIYFWKYNFHDVDFEKHQMSFDIGDRSIRIRIEKLALRRRTPPLCFLGSMIYRSRVSARAWRSQGLHIAAAMQDLWWRFDRSAILSIINIKKFLSYRTSLLLLARWFISMKMSNFHFDIPFISIC